MNKKDCIYSFSLDKLWDPSKSFPFSFTGVN